MTEIEHRFWSKAAISPGCWLWRGLTYKNRAGERYGQFRAGGKMIGAHRVAYMLATGPIPDGMIVRHLCDTPLCVNPTHLLLGTHRDNKQDSIKRGRHAQSETNGRAKMTRQSAARLAELYLQGQTASRLATDFGITERTVYTILAGKSRWGVPRVTRHDYVRQANV